MAGHYRTIEVGDRTYEYVVGRTATKVKGVGSFDNSILTQYDDADPLGRVAVKPRHVASAISRKLAGEIVG